MNGIDPATLDRLPLEGIDKVTFYKRDELTTDLICCDVEIGGQTWFFHEEVQGWDLLLGHVGQLPDFRRDWYESVAQPPFKQKETVAYAKPTI
jgi:hypothetical protein